MKLHYDPATDALYLKLVDAPVVESEEVRPGIVLDFDSQSRVVSIEVLHVSKQLPEADLKKLQLEVA